MAQQDLTYEKYLHLTQRYLNFAILSSGTNVLKYISSCREDNDPLLDTLNKTPTYIA